ncbi:MAG: DUF370 domain-containing protein [Desulfarculales bacterium]|jgi:regulator of extracellular matrix RemA (YlzA/DUF370 family)|nr:DUF370 domain-containing protein [Desulfarculales bacterium]
MAKKLMNLGFGNMVVAKRVLAIISPNSSPMKRLREEARSAGLLLDATQGRRTRSLIIMDSGHVVLSAIQVETMALRFEQANYEGQALSLEDNREYEV